MTRATFGGTAGDFLATVGPGGVVRAAGGTLTMWDAETAGTQHTDLLLDGNPVTTIPVGNDGQVPTFQGPDSVGSMWADAGFGRVRLLSDQTATALDSDAFVAGVVTDDGSDTAAAVDARITAATGDVVADVATLAADIAPLVDVTPNGIIEGRTLFTYGPSRGVGVTASRIHFDRLRQRMRAGFAYNGCTGGYFAADACTVAYGAIPHISQHGSADAWTTSSAVSTWANRAMWGGIAWIWPFGADGRDDGLVTRNSTTAKARAGAANALHAFIALVRSEVRIESSKAATYSITNGSPNVTGASSKWYKGMLVQGTGIPANTYIGDIIGAGTGFKLSSSRTTQVDVNATATNAAASLTISPVYTGTWAAVNGNTAFSESNMVKTNVNAATSTYVLHLTESRRVQWVTTAVDDAEYVATKGAPFGGTGGASYSVVVDGGTPVTGTTSNQHRFGSLDLCHGQKAVDLGVLGAGVHTIAISSTSTGLLVDECLLIESLTPPTVLVMKEPELPAAYYALFADRSASYAKTVIYNNIIDAEVAAWPADESVITMDVTDYGFDHALHVSARDGAYAHFNDPGERVVSDAMLTRLNELSARPGLVWN